MLFSDIIAVVYKSDHMSATALYSRNAVPKVTPFEEEEESTTMDNKSAPPQKTPPPDKKRVLTRRSFIKVVGVFTVGAGAAPLLSCVPIGPVDPVNPNPDAAMGYILVDSKKCQGCLSCMIACSLANEGRVNLSLARLQVVQNSFLGYPNDITVNQCRQCEEAECLKACPTGALHIDRGNGNVRTVDPTVCIGCGLCVQACPFEVERPVLGPESVGSAVRKSRKCDLCQSAPHHWIPNGGGVGGVQSCAAVCPMDAIKFTTRMPIQEGSAGYDVNLRDAVWETLGYPID